MKSINSFWKMLFVLGVFLINAETTVGCHLSNYHSAADTNKIVKVTYPELSLRDGKGLAIPLPPKAHPRLFLNPSYLPALRQNLGNPIFKICRERITDASRFTTDGNLADKENNNDLKVRDAIEAKALIYLLNSDLKAGQEAIRAVLNYYATLKIDLHQQDITRSVGRCIVTGSIVYDWCYPLLTKQEKTILTGRMETLATQMEIGWPAIKGSSITSHATEAQLARDMLALGIAVYDEKPVIYNRIAGRIMAEFVPVRNFFYPGGFHHQGSAYGAYRFKWDMFTTFIFDRMGYPDIYGKQQALIPYYFIYDRRPDGQLLRQGDDYNEQFAPFGKWWNLGENAFYLAGSYFRDPLLVQEALKSAKPGENPEYLFDFLLIDPNIFQKTAAINKLPLTRYFDEPLGAMIARTGWQAGLASPDVVASMKIGTVDFANHQHLDAGSFQLYYKGPLTVQSGIYQGTNGGYGSAHFMNYSQRTIAHNTILVNDPNEHFTYQGKEIVNDGGQFYPNGGAEPLNLKDLKSNGYHVGKILAHAIGPDTLKPDFSYLKGDVTESYSSKVKRVRRSFVFLNLNNANIPAALVVYDDIRSSDKNFKKTWLMHTVEEPMIDGATVRVERTEKGYNGKMINTTLLPLMEDLVITKTGGPGHQFEVSGKNFAQAILSPEKGSADSAMWRINISPKLPELQNRFLNVMLMMDRGVQPPPSALPTRIETGNLTGARIADRLVLFSKSGELIANNVSLKVKGKGVYKVLITDLTDGSWVLYRGSKATKLIKTESHTIYFSAFAGDYKLMKK